MSFWNSIRQLLRGSVHDDEDDDALRFSDDDSDADSRSRKSRGQGSEERFPSHHIPFPKY